MERRDDLERALDQYRAAIAFGSHRDAIKAVLDTVPSVTDDQIAKFRAFTDQEWDNFLLYASQRRSMRDLLRGILLLNTTSKDGA